VAKNLCGKRRGIDNPYEIWRAGNWEWKVLKKYQCEDKEVDNPHARWFCAVKSPFTYDSWELGDCYIREIVEVGERIA